MAGRIRSIKPEWLEDEDIGDASIGARFMSVALITLADDEGRGEGSIKKIAAKVFMYDADYEKKHRLTQEYCDELERIGYVAFYEVEGKRFFAVNNFKKHQKIDRPSVSKFPAPPSQKDVGACTSNSTSPREESRGVARSREPSRKVATDLDLDLDLDQGSGSGEDQGSQIQRVRAREAEPVKAKPQPKAPDPLPEVFDLDSVARVFGEEREAAGGMPYSRQHSQYRGLEDAVTVFTECAKRLKIPPIEAARRSARNFCAESWAKENKFPAGAWLKDPAKNLTEIKPQEALPWIARNVG